MKRSLVLAAALAAALPFSALAHKAWLQPSQTVIAGEKPWITVDAAVSNDLFYFNHVPLRLDSLIITAPDGSVVQAQNAATGKYRSVFDVELTQQGTYRLANVNAGLSATWQEDGKPKRWRGNAEKFAAEVPKDAPELKVSETAGRIETFVTNGNPNDTALKPTGKGLEMVALGHPNDLVNGEQAKFRLLVDGKPQAGLEVEITRGGTRYRNAQDEIKVTTDAKGEFSVTWPDAGMYWLETGTEDNKTSVPQANVRRLSYVATLEVLPQ
ncbi:Nickel uptake substrate-specific transmembrane region [compost metagenome]